MSIYVYIICIYFCIIYIYIQYQSFWGRQGHPGRNSVAGYTTPCRNTAAKTLTWLDPACQGLTSATIHAIQLSISSWRFGHQGRSSNANQGSNVGQYNENSACKAGWESFLPFRAFATDQKIDYGDKDTSNWAEACWSCVCFLCRHPWSDCPLHPVAFSCPFPFALVGWLMLIGIVSSFGYLGCFWPSLSWIISRVGVLCPVLLIFASAPKSVEQNNQLYINHCQTRINKIYKLLSIIYCIAHAHTPTHTHTHTHTHQSTHCELLLHAEREWELKIVLSRGLFLVTVLSVFFFLFILISTGAKRYTNYTTTMTMMIPDLNRFARGIPLTRVLLAARAQHLTTWPMLQLV